MLPRNSHIGTNSTQLDASFGDPATTVIATDADTRIGDFLAALRQDWWPEAACRGFGIGDFYAGNPTATARALQTCGTCPSLLPCRAEAIADPHLDYGIRGGMDVNARRNARRLQRPPADAIADA